MICQNFNLFHLIKAQSGSKYDFKDSFTTSQVGHVNLGFI